MKNIITHIFSRPQFQFIFEKILNLSLKILNIGEGHTVETSGEKVAFDILRKYKNRDTGAAIVFDVGAHTGEWLQIFKKNYKDSSILYSFEPSLSSFKVLSRITTDNFHPEHLALGDTIGKGYLSADVLGSKTSCVNAKNNNSMETEEISVTTIDAFCNEHKITRIDLLKIDVEGYELKVLQGAQRMLKHGNIKLIQFEFGAPSSEKYSLRDFFDILGNQYQICRILKHGCYPLNTYHHYYEIMTLTNFIAIKKDN